MYCPSVLLSTHLMFTVGGTECPPPVSVSDQLNGAPVRSVRSRILKRKLARTHRPISVVAGSRENDGTPADERYWPRANASI